MLKASRTKLFYFAPSARSHGWRRGAVRSLACGGSEDCVGVATSIADEAAVAESIGRGGAGRAVVIADPIEVIGPEHAGYCESHARALPLDPVGAVVADIRVGSFNESVHSGRAVATHKDAGPSVVKGFGVRDRTSYGGVAPGRNV